MTILDYLLAYKYLAMFLGALVEGPVLTVAVGFFLKLGYFNLVAAYLALVLGDLAGDVAWYYLGYHGAQPFIRRFGKFFSVTEEAVERLTVLFRKHEGRVLFINKITIGFGFTIGTLMAAGMSRVPLKKFVLFNFLGGLIWTGFLMVLGFVFGNVYLQVGEGLRVLSLVAFIIIFSLALNGFGRYMRGRLASKKEIIA